MKRLFDPSYNYLIILNKIIRKNLWLSSNFLTIAVL